MSQCFNLLKGDTIIGWVEITDEAAPEGTIRIGSLVGSRACEAAGVSWEDYVNDYWANWDRLDNDPALDAEPWGLTPNDKQPDPSVQSSTTRPA